MFLKQIEKMITQFINIFENMDEMPASLTNINHWSKPKINTKICTNWEVLKKMNR